MKTDFSDILKNRKENILKSYSNAPLKKQEPIKEDKTLSKGEDMDGDDSISTTLASGGTIEDKSTIKKALDLLCGDSIEKSDSEEIEKAEKKEVKKDSKKPEPKDDKFDHHRKMAGYHHLKAKDATDSAFDLNNSSDKDIQGKAGESSKVAQHHAKMMEQHMQKAKDLHDKEKHGDWNKTIPTANDAMGYGKKYDKDLSATKESDQAVIEKKDNVKKALDILSGDSIEKGGVGSGKRYGINRKYTHFAVHKTTGKILDAWDYKHHAKEDMKDIHKTYSHMDLRDNDIDPKNVNIVSKQKLSKTIDPFHTDNWSKSPQTEGMEDSTKKE